MGPKSPPDGSNRGQKPRKSTRQNLLILIDALSHPDCRATGLAALAREVIQQDVFSGALFIFIGRRFDAIKILYWDRNGFAVWYKVIESQEKFHWPRLMQEEVVTLTTEQLRWLLEGYDVWTQPHQMLRLFHAH